MKFYGNKMKEIEYLKLLEIGISSPNLISSLEYATDWIRKNKNDLVIYDVVTNLDRVNNVWCIQIYYKFVKKSELILIRKKFEIIISPNMNRKSKIKGQCPT